jgi:hypothetical protein
MLGSAMSLPSAAALLGETCQQVEVDASTLEVVERRLDRGLVHQCELFAHKLLESGPESVSVITSGHRLSKYPRGLGSERIERAHTIGVAANAIVSDSRMGHLRSSPPLTLSVGAGYGFPTLDAFACQAREDFHVESACLEFIEGLADGDFLEFSCELRDSVTEDVPEQFAVFRAWR